MIDSSAPTASRSPTPRPRTGPIETRWERRQFARQAGQPGQQAQADRHRRRHRARRRLRRARPSASSATTSSRFCYQDSAAPRALDRRAGRHQRRQELPQRRRQRLPPVLRHGQGRRLPLSRVERLPARRRCRVNIIDQCVAQGVPFAREYGGLLDNRSFGGAQVSRTFYARGQTGQQLLLGAYQALQRQIGPATSRCTPGTRCSTCRRRRPGPRHRRRATWSPARSSTDVADAVVLATGGYGNVFFLSTNAKGCNVTATWRAHRTGALLRQPLLHADPPDLHPGQRRRTSRSSR